MYFRLTTLLLISLLFVGCSSKTNRYETQFDTIHEQAITQTKKATIRLNNQIKAYIVATYLNQVEHELAGVNEKLDRFLIAIYVKGKPELYQDISVLVNETNENLKTTKIKENDPLLEVVPTSNLWGEYRLVEIPSIQSKTLTLTFETSEFGTVSISFPKEHL